MATTDRLLYISSDGFVRQLGFDPTAADLGGAAGVASSTHAATSKATPVDADEIPLSDSAASWGLKKLTWANIKATLKTYFDTLYQAVGTYVTPTTLNNGTLPASVTTLVASGNTTLGDASTDTLNVGNGGLIKDASGNVGIGVSPLTGTTSTTWINGDITLNSNMRSVHGNLYYAGGWKYTGNGSGSTIKFSESPTMPMVLMVAPNNASGAGATAVPIGALTFDTAGGVLAISPTGGLGYGTGAGGTVTQATSKATAVTLNKPCGQITMNNAALGAGGAVAFAANNSLVSANDLVLVGANSNGNYRVEVQYVAAGNFGVRVTNVTVGSLSEALVINFAVIKGATS